jgi:hypothetical protein
MLLIGSLAVSPADGRQVSADEHAKHHPEAQADNTPPVPPPATAPRPKGMAGMKAMDRTTSNALLDELVQKMNAAQGEAKVDAIAELLTALVRTHQRMHAESGSMMSKRHANPEGVAAK